MKSTIPLTNKDKEKIKEDKIKRRKEKEKKEFGKLLGNGFLMIEEKSKTTLILRKNITGSTMKLQTALRNPTRLFITIVSMTLYK